MATAKLARGAVALFAATMFGATGVSGALAQQDNLGPTVTIPGGVGHVHGGGAVNVAPGVVISGGTVSNETGIGVIISGGSSVGGATGGDTNTSADQ